MPLLLITTDLMIQSRVTAAAERANLPPPKTCTWQEATALDNASYRLVILDLSTPGVDVADAVSTLRQLLPQSAVIVAFAPHVHTAKLTAARDAGCDQVLSRGQFDRDLNAILASRMS